MSQLSLCKLSKLSLCIVITFFQQVLDNDRLKTLLQHFVHHFCTIAVIMFMTAQGYVWAFREHRFKRNFSRLPLSSLPQRLWNRNFYPLPTPLSYLHKRKIDPSENLVMLLWQKFFYLVITLLPILLIPSFWTQQLNT